jgi:hypothetical protein
LKTRWIALVWAVSVLLSTSAAAWEKASEVIHGTARVLDQGETIIGVVSPLGYGIHDQVTLFTHPALHLLLTPTIWLRASLYDGRTAVALEAGYQTSLVAIEDAKGNGRFPGFAQLGVVASYLLRDSVQLSAAVGYVAEFGRLDLAGTVAGIYYKASADFLFRQRYLIKGELRGRVLGEVGAESPVGTLILAREFGRMRIGVGAAFGRFVIATGDMSLDPETQKAVQDTVRLPVYPWIDVWWRF